MFKKETGIVEIKKDMGKMNELILKLAKSQELTNDVVTSFAQDLTDYVGQAVTEQIGSQIKEQISTAVPEIEVRVLNTVEDTINASVKTAVGERGLNRKEINKLTKTRNKKMCQLLGNPDSDRYKLFAPFYFGKIAKEFRKTFECDAYGDVDANRFDEAVEFLNNFTITPTLNDWYISTIHKNYKDGELDTKRVNAYRRYFGLVS